MGAPFGREIVVPGENCGTLDQILGVDAQPEVTARLAEDLVQIDLAQREAYRRTLGLVISAQAEGEILERTGS